MTTYNTGNPVGSTDARDLYDNSQTLDQLVNGSGTYSNRLGVQRRTLAKLEADFDAQLADAESDLNVYRSEAAASAAEAFGYLQAYRATSYGALASDPETDPVGNPPTVGDEYFNTTANLLKRWNGTTWQASDINTANLAASSGSSLVGYDGQTVQDVLDGAKSMQSYTALRNYTGRATGICITTPGVAGFFQRLSAGDTYYSATDDGGVIIVDALGRRWMRLFVGPVNVKWFGAKGDYVIASGIGTDDTAAILSAINAGWFEIYFPDGFYKTTAELAVKPGTRLTGSSRTKAVIINVTATADVACVKTPGVSMTEPFFLSHFGLRSINGPALKITKGAQFLISSIKCSNSKYGLLADTCLIGKFNACAFDSNTVAGVKMSTSYDVDFISCRVESNPIGVTLGFGTDSCYGIRFLGGTVEYNTVKNFELENCFDTLLLGVWIEGGPKGVEAGVSSRNTTVISCQFLNQSNATWNGIGLHCLGQDGIKARDNRFSDSSIVATGGRGMLQDNYMVGAVSTITLPAMPNLWSFLNQSVQYTKEGTSSIINIYKQLRNSGTYEFTSDINPDGYIKCNAGAICVAGDGVYRKTTGVTDAFGWVLLNASLKSYTTGSRPAATSVPAGYQIWNSTTAMPNYSDGTVWRNAAGAAV